MKQLFFYVLMTVVLCISCETSIEEPVVINTFPLESGGIIYGDWTPIKIGFSETMTIADAAYLAAAVNVWDHNYAAVLGSVTWEDNAIYFHPKEKWKSGEKYACRINGTFSALDGRVAGINTELVFFVVTDIEIASPASPEVAEIFLLRKNGADGYKESEYDADAFWNNTIQGECGLRILFDREMDLSEPKNSLRMEPYRDYAVKVINNQTLDVYFKNEPSPVKKLSFTVKEDMHSLAGEKLERDYTFEFTEWESDFQFDKLIVWESIEFEVNDDSALDLSQLSEPYLVGAEYYQLAGTRLTEFTFNFNYPVNLAAGLSILSKIELVPDDERIGNAPSLVEIMISASDYDQTWYGMEYGTLNSPYRYLLKIPGGIEGISDGNGHYLKEDMTLMLNVIDYDELLDLLDD